MFVEDGFGELEGYGRRRRRHGRYGNLIRSARSAYGPPAFGDLEGVWGDIKGGAKKVGKAATKTVKAVAKAPVTVVSTVAKAPAAVVKAAAPIGSGALKTVSTVAAVPFKAASAIAKTGAGIVATGAKSAADIAKSAGRAAGTVAALPTRITLEATKGIVGGAAKTVGGAFRSGSKPKAAPGVSPETAQAAADVAASQGVSPESGALAPASFSTSPAGGFDAETSVARSGLVATEEGAAGEGKPGMSLAMKVGIGAGAALILFLGYRAMKKGRRGGGRPKS